MVSELEEIVGLIGQFSGPCWAAFWALLSSLLGLTKPFYAFLCQGLVRLREA